MLPDKVPCYRQYAPRAASVIPTHVTILPRLAPLSLPPLATAQTDDACGRGRLARTPGWAVGLVWHSLRLYTALRQCQHLWCVVHCCVVTYGHRERSDRQIWHFRASRMHVWCVVDPQIGRLVPYPRCVSRRVICAVTPPSSVYLIGMKCAQNRDIPHFPKTRKSRFSVTAAAYRPFHHSIPTPPAF